MISENFKTEDAVTLHHGDLILTVGGSLLEGDDGFQLPGDGDSQMANVAGSSLASDDASLLTLDYEIQDPIGIHARPAGELLKLAKKFKSEIFFSASGKTVQLNSIFSLMSLGVKKGTTVHIEARGEDGAEAIQAFRTYLQAHL